MAPTPPVSLAAGNAPVALGPLTNLGPGALRGVLLAVAGFFLFASSDAIIKTMTARYSIFQIMIMQVAFGFIPFGVMLVRAGGLRALRPIHPRLVVARGLLSGVGTICGFFAFAHLPLADAYAIAFGAPILVTILSIPVLGERVGPHRWSAVVVGFIGILIMVRPGSTSLQLGHLGALGGMGCGAAVTLILRRIGRVEHGSALVLSVMLGLLVVSLPVLPFVASMPGWRDLGLMAVSGLFMGTAQFVMLQAFRSAPAVSVAPMQYTMMVWALLYGLILFGDPIRANLVLGAGVVILSSLYIMHRERHRRGREAFPRVAVEATGPS
jgi:drug/metabolite transporter (DMT)-like permease